MSSTSSASCGIPDARSVADAGCVRIGAIAEQGKSITCAGGRVLADLGIDTRVEPVAGRMNRAMEAAIALNAPNQALAQTPNQVRG